MVFSRFRIQIVARVIGLGATIALLFYSGLYAGNVSVAGGLGLIFLFQIFYMIKYLDRTNKDIAGFFLAIKNDDYTQSFTMNGLDSPYNELRQALNELNEAFRVARSKAEENSRYLLTVIRHISTGLIAYSPDGHVHLINIAAKRLLGVNSVRNIHDLAFGNKELMQILNNITPGASQLVNIENCEQTQLTLHASIFRVGGQSFTLVSFQDIYHELAEREMDTSQNLIRVLTHEIMNSITPITSLAGTAGDLLGEVPVLDESIMDVREAVRTIQKRGEGLLQFVDAYRNLARIPKPSFQMTSVTGLLDRVVRLMLAQTGAALVEFHTVVEPASLELAADPSQVEQVLINIVQNALQVLGNTDSAHVSISARMDGRSRVLIEVEDNGPGIVDEAIEDVFIPFYTTRSDGSGIGLSLCRQIMRMHGGTITVASRPGRTVFTLRF